MTWDKALLPCCPNHFNLHIVPEQDKWEDSEQLVTRTSCSIEGIIGDDGGPDFNKVIRFLETSNIVIVDGFFKEEGNIDKILFSFFDFLRHDFFSENMPISPKVIESIRNCPSVRDGIISYVREKNMQIRSIRHIEQYDMVAFHFFLLWKWHDFDLLKDIQSGHFSEIKALFFRASADISQIIGSVKSWNNTAHLPGSLMRELYSLLEIGETANKLALIHTSNFEERQISFQLGEIIRDHIDNIDNLLNTLKSQVSDFKEGKNVIQKLRYLSGRIQWNFAYCKKINGNTIAEIQEGICEMKQSHQESFDRQKDACFGWDPEEEESSGIILLGNSALADGIEMELIRALPGTASPASLGKNLEFLHSFVAVYNYGMKKTLETPKEVIDDFVQNGIKNEYQTESVYNIVLFNDSISYETLLKLTRFLLENSDSSYEEFMVKITAQTIRRFRAFGKDSGILLLVEEIHRSLEAKNISHSVLSYSKVYLALALYLIECTGKKYTDLAEKCFVHYKNLSAHLTSVEKNPKNVRDERYFYTTVGWLDEMTQYWSIADENRSERAWVYAMKRIMENYRQSAILSIEDEMEHIIASMTNARVDTRSRDHASDSFGGQIAEKIAEKIFDNICTIEIVRGCPECQGSLGTCDSCGISSEMEIRKSLHAFQKRWYGTECIRLDGSFFIVFTYPLTLKKTFDGIFSQYNSLIKERLGNLIAINNQNMELEWSASHNLETGLPNWNALEKVLGDDTGPEKYHIVCVRMEEQNHNVAAIRKDVIEYIATGIKKTDNRILPYYTATAFVFLLPTGDFDSDAVAEFASNFEKTIKPENSQSLHNAHIGYSLQWENIPHIQLYNQASLALETSATHGGISVYTEVLQKDHDTKEKNRKILREALTNESEDWEIIPFYQEIDFRIKHAPGYSKYEALMRVHNKKTGQYFPPQPFLDAIDGSSRDQKDISFRMLDRTLHNIEKYSWLYVSFNMHMFDFDDEAVYSRLISLDEQLCARMTIEILESVDLNDKVVVQKVRNLKQLWFSIAFDDSGKARANADRFYQYPSPDFVKIDGYYVTRLDHANTLLSAAYEKLDAFWEQNPDTLGEINKIIARDTLQRQSGQNEIVEDIQKYMEHVREPKLLNILKHIELRTRRFLGRYNFLSSQVHLIKEQWSIVIAEFVENETIRSILETMGVEWFQWYGIRKPLPIEEIFQAD